MVKTLIQSLSEQLIPRVKLRTAHFCSTAQPKLKPTSPSHLSPITATKLIKSYSEQGLLSHARQLFDEMPDKDIIAWTAMISGYTSNGHHVAAWAMFHEMMGEGVAPNAFTVSSVLKACKGMEWCNGGAMVHGLAVKYGVDGLVYVENTLLDVYATCGVDVHDACTVFEGISAKTAVSWTTMIAGYTRRGEGHAGIQVFRRMIQEGAKLNPFTCSIAIRACASVGSLVLGKQIHAAAVKSGYDSNLPIANSLIVMYCRCMSLSEAKQFFEEMPQRDLITWNSIIAGLARSGSHEALQLLLEMGLQDIQPNCFTFTSIVSACANFAVLNCGQQVHGAIIRRGFGGNLQVSNALIDMYAKCGSVIDSQRIFSEMPQKDLVSWTSMMIGYGIHGYGKEAMELFDEMVDSGIRPDLVVFVGVLSACSHAGLVDEGLKYFNLMSSEYNVPPDKEVYGCVVDLLGRAGRVMEAYKLIETMPFEPDELIWGALLGACKMHREMGLGELAAKKILDLRPKEAKNYVILSNIYAASSEWGEFAKTRRLLRGMGSKKEAGRSWIDVGNNVCGFVAGDRSNPYVGLVYMVLDMLVQHMSDAGHISDSYALLHDLEGVT